MTVVQDFLNQGYESRIHQSAPDICSVDVAADIAARWRDAGATVVFMAGTFDIPTPNHRLGLAEARLMGAALTCGIDYASLTDGTVSPKIHREVMDIAASDAVKLMVTTDTDDRVAASKGFQYEKGGGPKPIFCWDTRAYNLASYTVPRSDGLNHTMVDFVTAHGPDACTSCATESCTSVDNALMVASILPSLVVVNAASTDTLSTVMALAESGKIPDVAIGITNEESNMFVDKLIGGRVSGTAIVRRARQGKDS